MAKEKNIVGVKAEKKAEKIIILASFVARDIDGNKTVVSFNGEGKDAQEALNGIEFPKGINALVKITAKKGDKEIERAVAPHKAQKILVAKSVYDFESVFRGL